MKIEEVSYKPICPYCEKELDVIHKIQHGTFEKHIVYICPFCKKILSIGADRWTG